MRKKRLFIIWLMGFLTLALFCLSACNRDLDVVQSYNFILEAMPVQKSLSKGETVEIRCILKKSGKFTGARYTIRYFQPDGKGSLKMDGTLFQPNDRYQLTKDHFRLYYTSLSTDRQTVDIYVEDNFGRIQQLTFNFSNKKKT